MRDSPAACGTLGLDMRWFRVGLFALSAGMAGLAGGAVRRAARQTIGAADFSYFNSLPLLLLAVVCGVTSVTGAALGGIGLMLLPVLQSYPPESAGLLFVVLARRRGPAGPRPQRPGRSTCSGSAAGSSAGSRRDPGQPADASRRRERATTDAVDEDDRRPRRPRQSEGGARTCALTLLRSTTSSSSSAASPPSTTRRFVAEAGRVTGLIGPERRRQDHLLQRDQRAAEARPAARSASTAATSPARRCTAAPSAAWAAPSSGSRRSAR